MIKRASYGPVREGKGKRVVLCTPEAYAVVQATSCLSNKIAI